MTASWRREVELKPAGIMLKEADWLASCYTTVISVLALLLPLAKIHIFTQIPLTHLLRGYGLSSIDLSFQTFPCKGTLREAAFFLWYISDQSSSNWVMCWSHCHCFPQDQVCMCVIMVPKLAPEFPITPELPQDRTKLGSCHRSLTSSTPLHCSSCLPQRSDLTSDLTIDRITCLQSYSIQFFPIYLLLWFFYCIFIYFFHFQHLFSGHIEYVVRSLVTAKVLCPSRA